MLKKEQMLYQQGKAGDNMGANDKYLLCWLHHASSNFFNCLGLSGKDWELIKSTPSISSGENKLIYSGHVNSERETFK